MGGSPKRFRNLSAIALLLVFAGQAALLTHAVQADHEPGEVCEICIGADRFSDALVAATPSIEPVRESGFSALIAAVPVDQRSNWTFRSRGPPQI